MKKEKDPFVIAVDFDGTCVSHEFPKVGKDIGAVPILKKLVECGHRLILNTMRSNCEGNTKMSKEFPEVVDGKFLDDAVNWFKENKIPLYAIYQNPEQVGWTTSPKCYAQLYIDDAALGIPLLQDWTGEFTIDEINTCKVSHLSHKSVKELIGRPYVDWDAVELMLYDLGLIPCPEYLNDEH